MPFTCDFLIVGAGCLLQSKSAAGIGARELRKHRQHELQAATGATLFAWFRVWGKVGWMKLKKSLP